MTGASTMLASRDVSGGKQALTLDVPEKASAAADEGHDLGIVAILDSHVDERRARHDLHIAFHGDLGRLEAQLGGELRARRSEEHTSELQSLMRISYAVFCLKNKQKITETKTSHE